jgi:hypothetical protein
MRILLFVLPVAFLGCDRALRIELPEREAPHRVVENDLYDPSKTGAVAGVVKWAGSAPIVQPVPIVPFQLNRPLIGRTVLNPNAPRIGPKGGLASVVVWLEGIDPRRAKPGLWTAVDVVLDDNGLRIDNGLGRAAVVPKGTEIRFVNRIAGIGGIRARGAEFFSYVFPEAERTATRPLERSGRTTITSASGQFWAIADIFVLDHSYGTVTDSNGDFRLENVPDGEYELVAWHPNWRLVGHERDPETGVVARWNYAAPVEFRTPIRIVAGGMVKISLAFTADDFR